MIIVCCWPRFNTWHRIWSLSGRFLEVVPDFRVRSNPVYILILKLTYPKINITYYNKTSSNPHSRTFFKHSEVPSYFLLIFIVYLDLLDILFISYFSLLNYTKCEYYISNWVTESVSGEYYGMCLKKLNWTMIGTATLNKCI